MVILSLPECREHLQFLVTYTTNHHSRKPCCLVSIPLSVGSVCKDPFPSMKLKSYLPTARISLLFLPTWEMSRRQDIFIFIFSTFRVPGPVPAPSSRWVFYLIHWDFNYLEAAMWYVHSLTCPLLRANFAQFLWNPSSDMVSTASPSQRSFGLSTMIQVLSDQSERKYPCSCSVPFIHSLPH